MSFPAPITVVSGSSAPTAPLVVLCHGIGEDETMFDHVVPHVPDEFQVLQMRGPVTAGRGHNWFERRAGRIHQPSLDEVMDWFEAWLDEVAPPDRPVFVVGFSAGSAFAGALLLRRPERYAGAAVLSGALPLDNMPSLATPGRLTGKPVFLTISAQDRIIREEYTRGTWRYLVSESGAGVTARVDPGEHEVTDATAAALGAWLRDVLATPAPTVDDAGWTALPQGLPARPGNRPLVTWAPPHQQWSDQSGDDLREELVARVRDLAGVELVEVSDDVPGQVSVRTAGGEFARLTPLHDTSVRVRLPVTLAREVVAQGWGQALPQRSAGVRLLVYGPRNKHELDVVAGILAEAHRLAGS